jgi:hypothetical protein
MYFIVSSIKNIIRYLKIIEKYSYLAFILQIFYQQFMIYSWLFYQVIHLIIIYI